MTKLLKDRETAPLLGIAPITLRKMRLRGDGPPFVKIGNRAVRYSESDVADYIAALTRLRSTSDTPPKS